MSHPVSSTTEQSQHETLIPLASYPDSQRKGWLSAETRDQVATGMKYDETAELPVGSQVASRDGQEHQDSGPGKGRLLSSSNTTRISRGRGKGEVIDL
eukprot:7813766-Pyramimonas_sp.AAC.1